MAAFNEKDITLLYVGKSSATALTTGGINTLGDGEIGIFNAEGTRLVAGATGDFMFVQGRGAETPIVGKKIVPSSVKTAKVVVPVAASEQVEYIGYDGVSAGSEIDVINENMYYARLYLDQSLTSNHGGQYIKHGLYTTGESDTQESIADGLVASFITNFSREAEKSIKFERLNDAAGTATTGTVDVVAGSKAIVASVPGDFTVGGYVRFGNADTDAVYKVVSISGTTVVLDIPYQGATAQFAIGAAEGFAAAGGNSAGVKLTGQPLTFKVGKFNYRKAKWDTSLEGVGSTTFSSTTSNAGTGTYEQAAELEWFYRGNNGEYFRMGEPNIYDAIKDVANETYAIVHLVVEEEGGYTTKNRRDMQFMLMIPSNVAGETVCTWAQSDGPADSILNVVDDILGTSIAGSLTA